MTPSYTPQTIAPLSGSQSVRRLLLHGEVPPEDRASLRRLRADEARTFQSRMVARTLPRGFYSLPSGLPEEVDVLIVQDGAAPAAVGGEELLGVAQDVFDDFWSRSSAAFEIPPAAEGTFVRLRTSGALGRAQSVRRVGRSWRMDVDSEGRLFDVGLDDVDVLDGDPRAADYWLGQPVADADSIANTVSFAKLSNPLTNHLYSFATTRTTFKPYQFIPVLKLLRSTDQRLLIADEVGLGKTIEAGLIWTELEQRRQMRRVLVVVPATLREKWRLEMQQRFMRSLESVTTARLNLFLDHVEAGEDARISGVISLETLRGAAATLDRLEELAPRFDLVIVDEAHALRNVSSLSNKVGRTLSELADALVFLSATPMNLGQDDLYNLISLLDDTAFPDPVVFQEQLEPNGVLNAIARGVSAPKPIRKTERLRLLDDLTASRAGRDLRARRDLLQLRRILAGPTDLPAESKAAVQRLTTNLNTLSTVVSRTRKADVPDRKALRVALEVEVEWTQAERAFYDDLFEFYLDRARESGAPSTFMMQMPLRQACSCLPVARDRLLERMGLNGEDVEDDAYAERSLDVVDFVGAIPTGRMVDTKLRMLVKTLREARRRGHRKVLIFSFFRGTVDYLAANLPSAFRAGRLHGGVPPKERAAVIEQFRRGEIDVLIANQVGSEGLDFQFCNVLVNYDLPWNPMQVEQRIGRLDRFGQEHEKIFIFNMLVPGTIETDIIARLYERIGVFERSIGDLEPILRSSLDQITEDLFDPRLSPAQRGAEIERWSVALHKRSQDISEIERESGLLTAAGQLEIEGLTDDGPSHGRYVGTTEVRRLLGRYLSANGGRLASRRGRWSVTGTPALASATFQESRLGDDRGDAWKILLAGMRGHIPVEVSFDPQNAEVGETELVTARHPLVRLAVRWQRDERRNLPRFGRISCDALGEGTAALVRIDVATSTGVDELCEIWATAVDAESGEVLPSLESPLLASLAEGRWQKSVSESPLPPLVKAMSRLSSAGQQRRDEVYAERASENEAIRIARISAEQRSVDLRFNRIDNLIRERRDTWPTSTYQRHVNQAAALDKERSMVESKWNDRRRLSLQLEFTALLYVEGRS